jgi:hypothetical protein
VGAVERIVRTPRRARALTLAFTVCAVLTVVGPWSASAQAAEPPPGPALLEAVQVQDMGTFDRVTFQFRADPPTLPTIRRAEYESRPVLEDASGTEIAVDGNAVLRIVMERAVTVDFSVDPPVTTYPGPNRIQANLPNVIEVVKAGEFEGLLSWMVGLRSGEVPATAQVFTDPTRVVVDIPHVVTAVVAPPTFTG